MRGVVDIHRIRPIFEVLFEKIWYGEAENDTFNRLVLAGYLDWRQIAMLRTYARYMRQIRIPNSQTFIAIDPGQSRAPGAAAAGLL